MGGTSAEAGEATIAESMVGSDKYDAIVRVDMFTNVYRPGRGWPVELAPQGLERLDFAKAMRVAPIGHFNVGKTWLLQKLCEGSGRPLNLPSGTSVHTQGLSLKLMPLKGTMKDSESCVFVDTAGLNSPAASVPALGQMLRDAGGDPMAAMDAMLQELRRQENFIRQVAYDFAQVFLLVVGQISQRDQLGLVQLIGQATQDVEQKEVIVVHNLKDMTLEQFRAPLVDQITGEAGPTYLQSMQQVFRLESRGAAVAMGANSYTIPEMFGAFGGGDSRPAVDMRHVFLTKHVPGADHSVCENEAVFQHIRNVIALRTPMQGSALRDLAKIATRHARNFVRLPGDNIEIRYDAARQRFQGGRRRAGEAAGGAEAEGALPAAVVDAEAEAERLRLKFAALSKAEPVGDGQELLKLEADCNQAYLKAQHVRMQFAALVDAKHLDGLGPDETVTPRPVMLGATAATAGNQQVRHNVSRVRGYATGMPFWITMIHMTVPALAKGELQRVREQLQWSFDPSEATGLSMVATPGGPESLMVRFRARILPLATKHVQLLNTAGDPQGGIATGAAVTVSERGVTVHEMGTRPFEAVGGAAEADFELSVAIHTKIVECVFDVPPVVNYARGILTVAVLCQLSEADLADPGNAEWVNGRRPTPEPARFAAGSNGSGDDTDALA